MLSRPERLQLWGLLHWSKALSKASSVRVGQADYKPNRERERGLERAIEEESGRRDDEQVKEGLETRESNHDRGDRTVDLPQVLRESESQKGQCALSTEGSATRTL